MNQLAILDDIQSKWKDSGYPPEQMGAYGEARPKIFDDITPQPFKDLDTPMLKSTPLMSTGFLNGPPTCDRYSPAKCSEMSLEYIDTRVYQDPSNKSCQLIIPSVECVRVGSTPPVLIPVPSPNFFQTMNTNDSVQWDDHIPSATSRNVHSVRRDDQIPRATYENDQSSQRNDYIPRPTYENVNRSHQDDIIPRPTYENIHVNQRQDCITCPTYDNVHRSHQDDIIPRQTYVNTHYSHENPHKHQVPSPTYAKFHYSQQDDHIPHSTYERVQPATTSDNHISRSVHEHVHYSHQSPPPYQNVHGPLRDPIGVNRIFGSAHVNARYPQHDYGNENRLPYGNRLHIHQARHF